MADLSNVTKYFPTPSEGYSSTLSSSITAGASVVPVVSASQYQDGDVVVLIVDPKTVDEAVFTGTKASNPDRFIDCVWTEGNTGVGHASGAVIADYVTATHLAMVTKGILKSHNQDGSLKSSGWITLTPLAPFSAPTPDAPLQIRKIANVVYIRGYVQRTSGFSANSTPVANIPAGYRPASRQSIALTTSSNTTIHSLVASGSSDQITVRQTAEAGAWFLVGGSWIAER